MTSEQKKEEQRPKTFGLVRVYTNIQIILYLIFTYNFSELNPHILLYIFKFTMTSVNQEDEFTEVTRKRKKRKAISSPMLPTLQKTGSSVLPPGTPTRPKPAGIKNTIPVIHSGIKEEHKKWRKLMGETRQFHPSRKISQIKELPKGDFLIIGDSMQDVLTLMKAALGQTVKVSLPKAFQSTKMQTKSLAVKGVPTDITDS